MSDKNEFKKYIKISNNLIENGQPVLGLFIAIAIFTGFRYDEIKKITWNNLLEKSININGKYVNIDSELETLIKKAHDKIKPRYNVQKFLLSRKKMVFSQQRLNIILKNIDESLSIKDLRRVYCRNFLNKSKNAFEGLVQLQAYFNNSNTNITAKFIQGGEKAHRISKGKVYIIKDELYPSWYKIGRAKNEVIREGTLLHHAPMLTMMKVVDSDDYVALETKIHRELKEYRAKPRNDKGGKQPEWFKLTDEKLNEIIEKYNFVDYE